MYVKTLIARKRALIRLSNQAQQHLKDAPDGNLTVSKSHGKSQYRRTLSDGTSQYIKQEQYELAKELAQKDYAQKILRHADEELRILNRLLKLQRVDESQQAGFRNLPNPFASMDGLSKIYLRLPDAKRKLVDPYVLPTPLFAEEWRAKAESRDDFRPEGRTFQTESGILVRSKSEVIIADKLYRAGVPFKYEQEIETASGTIHPDFVILKTSSRKEIVWEHFGMMDDPTYCNHCIRKIALYASRGIVLGDNLIATLESSAIPLDTVVVDKLIANLAS